MSGFFGHGAGITFGGSAIGGLLDVPLPGQEAEEIEETDMDSGGFREFMAGLVDGGSLDLVVRMINGDVGQDAMVAAIGGAAGAVVIQAPGGTGELEWQFAALVLGYGGTLFWEGATAERTFTLRVSGKVTETVQS